MCQELLDKLTLLLLTETLTREQVHSLISHLVQAGEAVDSVVLYANWHSVPQHGDELMTIAQQLEQKGIEKVSSRASSRASKSVSDEGLKKVSNEGLKRD